MQKGWRSLIRGRKGAQTVEYVIILVAGALLAGILYNFLSGGELKNTLETKIEQIIAGNVGNGKAPRNEKQPEPKPPPKPQPEPKKEEKDKPWWKKFTDNRYVKEGTDFVLDSVPVVSNIKSGYEAARGKDIFGNKLSKTDRAIAATGVLIPGAKHIKRGVKVADKGLDAIKGSKKNRRVNREGCTCPKEKQKKGTPTKVTFSADSKKHVRDRHVGNKPGWEHKSKWTVSGGEWVTYSRKTFRKPDKVSKDGDRFVYEKEFSDPIGVDANGDKLYKVRVVVEKDGEVVTSFPQKDWKK
ncbi:hypothetical protein JOD24_002248 [Kroppenstedtia sanguinis]|uniref:DUF4244 domain-containing protein n=1 Tax=Kroppenstedtia sanguinis TaxID=1380684 RepID=A0ABW4CCQ1_9BACL